jgi:hypothetical protein
MMGTVFDKMEFYSGADEKGKWWEFRGKDKLLREADLAELAEWIAREIGWIKRSRTE